MAGSKVGWVFCCDLVRLVGQEKQRPNQETWSAMTLEEQQSFAYSMLKQYTQAPEPVVPPVAPASPVIETPQDGDLASELHAHGTPEELGVTVAPDGTVEPLPGNEIVPDGQGGAVVQPVQNLFPASYGIETVQPGAPEGGKALVDGHEMTGDELGREIFNNIMKSHGVFVSPSGELESLPEVTQDSFHAEPSPEATEPVAADAPADNQGV